MAYVRFGTRSTSIWIFEIERSVSSLEDMAQATQNIYFNPKPKMPTALR